LTMTVCGTTGTIVGVTIVGVTTVGVTSAVGWRNVATGTAKAPRGYPVTTTGAASATEVVVLAASQAEARCVEAKVSARARAEWESFMGAPRGRSEEVSR